MAGDPATGQTLVTGDAVNVAARLEQSAQPGEILIGEATYRLLRDAVAAEPIEPMELKGKDHPVMAYRLLGVHPEAEAVRRHLDSPMVGRDRQLALMKQTFESAADDRACHLFTVIGSPGVGKSRLVHEFVSAIAGQAFAFRAGARGLWTPQLTARLAGLTVLALVIDAFNFTLLFVAVGISVPPLKGSW